jgi:hypothetical protein
MLAEADDSFFHGSRQLVLQTESQPEPWVLGGGVLA